ncbi:MAG: tetratricopeptide repeat protein [Nitrospirota bacterium]
MDPKELLGQAQLLFAEGKERESIDAFTKALEAGAEPFIVYLSIGVIYMKLKETDKAIDNFNKAVEVNDSNPRTYYYRGMAFMDRGEFEKAVSDFSKALERKPDLYPSKFARSAAYARLGKFDESTNDLKDVLPQMEAGAQSFADSYGIVRTEMFKVMAQISGEREVPTMNLSEKEIDTLKKWLEEE